MENLKIEKSLFWLIALIGVIPCGVLLSESIFNFDISAGYMQLSAALEKPSVPPVFAILFVFGAFLLTRIRKISWAIFILPLVILAVFPFFSTPPKTVFDEIRVDIATLEKNFEALNEPPQNFSSPQYGEASLIRLQDGTVLLLGKKRLNMANTQGYSGATSMKVVVSFAELLPSLGKEYNPVYINTSLSGTNGVWDALGESSIYDKETPNGISVYLKFANASDNLRSYANSHDWYLNYLIVL